MRTKVAKNLVWVLVYTAKSTLSITLHNTLTGLKNYALSIIKTDIEDNKYDGRARIRDELIIAIKKNKLDHALKLHKSYWEGSVPGESFEWYHEEVLDN